MKMRVFRSALACALLFGAPFIRSAWADVTLPSVIGSHMVLQRDMPLPVWGWADPEEKVTVTLDGKSAAATADAKGKWKITLPAHAADGKPHTLTIQGKNKIELTDILLGEVWVGSGQSNMEFHLSGARDQKEAIAAADQPEIRLFSVPKVTTAAPARDVKAAWLVCTPKTAPAFSGVLYHFGLRLHKELKLPIGLIHSSWGGSAIAPWTVEQKSSGQMYNGMIAPLQPFAVRGITWYQGESSVFSRHGLKYREMMERLIKGWRRTWGEDLPFYFVQIAPWSGYPKDEEPPVWEAQAATLKIPGTGMVVTTDLVDNLSDIHPNNKKDVGNRLALWALAKTYDRKDLVYLVRSSRGSRWRGTRSSYSSLTWAAAWWCATASRCVIFRLPARTGNSCPPRPRSRATTWLSTPGA